ncbi:MAG TPA: hypothetical protein VHZ73_11280 [Vicinamibacterales bacterium]|nr:hypothetical protein [Vicinamibacterales bacterium]
MAGQDFFFSLEFSSQGAPAALLEQLASQLLSHVGVSAADLPELSEALNKAVEDGSMGGKRRCDVQFRAQGSKLEIVVTANGGRVWQTTRSLPANP